MAEGEYIEREIVRNTIKALCEKYNQAFGGHYGGFGEELAKTIDNMPAADIKTVKAELVKCKDCKHFLFDTDFCKKNNRGYCEFDNTIKAKSHFCGYGERKGNGA